MTSVISMVVIYVSVDIVTKIEHEKNCCTVCAMAAEYEQEQNHMNVCSELKELLQTDPDFLRLTYKCRAYYL